MARALKYLLYGVAAFAAGTSAAPVCSAPGGGGASPRVFEAEDATLGGTTVDTAQAGFTGELHIHDSSPQLRVLIPNLIVRSGTGYVTGFEDATDKVTFTIDSETTQLYDLSIRAAAIYGEKRTTVILNGGASSEVLFPAADTWADIAGGQLLLNAGDNTVEIVSNWGWYVPRPLHLKK